MGAAKIKNLVVAALVLVNIVFLFVILKDKADDAISRKDAIENACRVLSDGGISIDPGDVREVGELRAMRTSRNPVEEQRIATVVLGPVVRVDQGVNYQYVNELRGTAVFYSGGDFHVEINEGLVVSERGTLSTVKKLLSEMGLETTETYLSGAPGQELVTAVCAHKKASVFNCTIRFEFGEGSLVSVSGRYVNGVEDVENGVEISSPGTALLGFLAWVKRGGAECSRIDAVEAGYQIRDTSALGDGVLSPAWLITADTGRYTIDAETGEIRPLPPVYE